MNKLMNGWRWVAGFPLKTVECSVGQSHCYSTDQSVRSSLHYNNFLSK